MGVAFEAMNTGIIGGSPPQLTDGSPPAVIGCPQRPPEGPGTSITMQNPLIQSVQEFEEKSFGLFLNKSVPLNTKKPFTPDRGILYLGPMALNNPVTTGKPIITTPVALQKYWSFDVINISVGGLNVTVPDGGWCKKSCFRALLRSTNARRTSNTYILLNPVDPPTHSIDTPLLHCAPFGS